MLRIDDYEVSYCKDGYMLTVNGSQVYTLGLGKPYKFASYNAADDYGRSLTRSVFAAFMFFEELL